MAIVKKKEHRINKNQKAKIKDYKNAVGKNSIGGKKIRRGKKTGRGKKNK